MEKIDIFKNEINNHWKWILGSIIVIVVVILWQKEKFINMLSAYPDSNLPFTGGSTLRVMSEDSATNRGFNNTWTY